MNHQQPMDLAELRVMVAQHLSIRDLMACSLVSKAWYTSFSPAVWSTFTAKLYFLDSRHSPIPSECRVPHTCFSCSWGKIVIKHGHHIRHLKFTAVQKDTRSRVLFQLLIDKCTSLTALTYHRAHGGSPFDTANKDLVTELMRRNPLIKSISTGSIPCLQQAITYLPKLTRLEVEFRILSDQAIQALLTAFTCLQELEFTSSTDFFPYHVANSADTPSQAASLPSRPSSLKRITWPYIANHSYGRPSSILQRCPALEYIDFGGMSFIDDASLKFLRSSDSLPQLSTLSIGHSEAFQRAVLEAMSRSPWIRDLRLHGPHPKSLSVIAKRYDQHLQHLVLTSIDCDIQSPITLFAQCSALKTLTIRAIGESAFNLKKLIDQPWACTQLEELEMPITLEQRLPRRSTSSRGEGENSEHMVGAETKKILAELEQIETAFMERLGCLTQLRRLALHPRRKTEYAKTRMDLMVWRLTAGFGHLQGLSRLGVLDLGYRSPTPGIHEFEWMKQHWTSLSRVIISEYAPEQPQEWFRNNWPEVKVAFPSRNPF